MTRSMVFAMVVVHVQLSQKYWIIFRACCEFTFNICIIRQLIADYLIQVFKYINKLQFCIFHSNLTSRHAISNLLVGQKFIQKVFLDFYEWTNEWIIESFTSCQTEHMQLNTTGSRKPKLVNSHPMHNNRKEVTLS